MKRTVDVALEVGEDVADLEKSEELESEDEVTIDWRDQVRKHPVVAIGAAFGTGVVLAGVVARRRRRAEVRPIEQLLRAGDARRRHNGRGGLRTIAGAFLATATRTLLRTLADEITVSDEASATRRR